MTKSGNCTQQFLPSKQREDFWKTWNGGENTSAVSLQTTSHATSAGRVSQICCFWKKLLPLAVDSFFGSSLPKNFVSENTFTKDQLVNRQSVFCRKDNLSTRFCCLGAEFPYGLAPSDFSVPLLSKLLSENHFLCFSLVFLSWNTRL